MKLRTLSPGLLACLALCLAACKKEADKPLAPEADALAPAQAASDKAVELSIDESASKLTFEMDAELEKIFGRGPASTQGALFVDVNDLTKSSGLVKVDLFDVKLYQRKRETKDQDYGAEKHSEKQNKDAQTWLQISEDAPADVREKNRWAEFKLEKFDDVSHKSLSALSGPERKIAASVSGPFRLHGRVTPKKVKIEALFRYEGDQLKSVDVRSLEPFGVALEEHDVKPRKAFDSLADSTLEALGAKVAKVAKISFEFRAQAK
jgi:hypothetical protein